MLLAFAEFERDTIMERMNEGKRIKREHGGKCEGRNRLDVTRLDEYVEKNRSGDMTVDECCSALGISRSTWYSRIREAG